MYFEFPAILNCRYWIFMMQYSISIVKTHWWQNCKYVSNKVTDINLIKMHIHVGYITGNDFWWVRKPNHLHVCSDSKSKEILQSLIFFALKSTERHKSYNKDSKNHFGQFKENISEQSLPKNIFINKKINRFSFWMQIFFCKSCSLLQILCFGIIHIVMNEKGDSFIRIHYGPFLSGNQKQNSGVWIIESNHHYREERCC